jgi:hypothetical protein
MDNGEITSRFFCNKVAVEAAPLAGEASVSASIRGCFAVALSGTGLLVEGSVERDGAGDDETGAEAISSNKDPCGGLSGVPYAGQGVMYR